MHIKKRSGRAMLYRSQYVRKGAVGNSHGYTAQTFVGSLRLDALEVPEGLVEKLSPDEMEYVEKTVLLAAKRVADEVRRAEEAARAAEIERERDPRWRVDDALRLLTEAGHLIAGSGTRIDASKVTALTKALDPLSAAARIQRDPLELVLVAVREATAAVTAGHYGTAPVGKVRDTAVSKRWRNIGEAVDSGEKSLLKALQAKGWAPVRNR